VLVGAVESEDPPPLSDQVVPPGDRSGVVTVLAPSAATYWTLLASLTWLLTIGLIALDPRPFRIRGLLISLIGPVMAIPIAGYMRTMFAIVVSDQGLSGRDARGKRVVAAWTDLHSVRVRRVAGFLLVEIATPRLARPIQISLFKVAPEELLAAIRRHAGSEHPVVRVYERAMHDICGVDA
jgi:hypothetical protein